MSSCVRIRRQNLPSDAKVLVSVASTTCTRSDSDLLRGSFKPRIQAKSWLACCRSTPWKLAWPQLLKQPPPPTSTLLVTRTRPQQSCTFRRRQRQQTRRGSKLFGRLPGPSVTNQTVSAFEHPNSAAQDEDREDMEFSEPRKSRLSAPQLQAQLSRLTDRTRHRRTCLGNTDSGQLGHGVAGPTIASLGHPGSQDDDSDDMDFSAPRKSQLSAPLQAQLSRLTDRTRLRRLKSTRLSKGAWQQVTRSEDLCHTQVSHKWLYHLDACAGSVLLHHQRAEKTWNQSVDRIRRVPPSWAHSWNMARLAAPPKPRGDTTHAFTLWCAD